MTVVLVASDLDRTLIYSRNALALPAGDVPDLTCVETYLDEPFSFMTSTAARGCAQLAEVTTFVPVTTRTPAQLSRVTLPGRAPRFAVAANGGALIVDGERDPVWDKQVALRLTEVAPLSRLAEHVAQVCRPEWTSNVRIADDLFCYAVIDRSELPAGFVDDCAGWAEQQGWVVSLQGRKLYWMPAPLTKAAAVTAIAEHTGAELILAAGDSLLDRDLLECAHLGIRPRHGELYESDWVNDTTIMTANCGVRAGQEIVDWFTITALRALA